MGASLNDSLWKAVGAVISTESRAMIPSGGARFTPDINMFRDPREIHMPTGLLAYFPRVGDGYVRLRVRSTARY